jgi:hypothetical protein
MKVATKECQASAGDNVKDQPNTVSRDQPKLVKDQVTSERPGSPKHDNCEVSVPVSRNGSGTYATSSALLLGLPPGLARAPNSFSLS